MSRFDAALRRMEGTVFDTFGDLALHTPATGDPIRRRVIVDRDVQRTGFDSVMVRRSVELSVLLSEGPVPRRGDVLTVLETDESFTVDASVENDGSVARVTVRE